MDIAVFNVTTAAAREDSIFQRQALVDQAALATKLARRKPAVGNDDLALRQGLPVVELPTELTEAHIADNPRQLAVSHHPLDAKILDDDAAVGPEQPCRQLV